MSVGAQVIYVDHRDLDSVESAKSEIVDQVKALERDPSDIETPISVSLDLQILRQSEKPEERSLADLVAAVSDLRTSLGQMEAKIGTKDQQGVLDEIQAELRSLPHLIDDHFDAPRSLSFRRGGLHPALLREFIRYDDQNSAALSILVVASIFRDWMPWIYELGVEIYRQTRSGDVSEATRTMMEFRRATEFALHGPAGREFRGRSKDWYILMREIEPLLDRTMKMVERDIRSRKRK